jgi:hypothetical protein
MEDQSSITKTDTKTGSNQTGSVSSQGTRSAPQTQPTNILPTSAILPSQAGSTMPLPNQPAQVPPTADGSPSASDESQPEGPHPFTEIPLDASSQTKVDLKQLRIKNRPVNTFAAHEQLTSFTNTAALRHTREKEPEVITRDSSTPERSVFTIFIFVATAAFAVFFGMKKNYIPTNFLPPDIVALIGVENAGDYASTGKVPGDVSTPAKPPETNQQPPTAAAKVVTFTIESIPQGARIYIDGKDTGAITPNRRQIDANQEFRLGLSKDGYSYFEKLERVTSDGTTLKLSLQPPPAMGYVSISVVNGGTDPVVYINGQRVNQKPPIRFYGIPAGVPVKIRILNPFTQLAAEKIITVSAAEKKDLTLVLSREASGH